MTLIQSLLRRLVSKQSVAARTVVPLAAEQLKSVSGGSALPRGGY